MTEQEIKTSAKEIFDNLTEGERNYAQTESLRRIMSGEGANTPFSCLHDLMDANELLPKESIAWDADDGPDFTTSNAIVEAFNELFLKNEDGHISLT